MSVSADEFIRRFLLRVLPRASIGSAITVSSAIAIANKSLPIAASWHARPSDSQAPKDYRDLTGRSLRQCPACRQGQRFKNSKAVGPAPGLTPVLNHSGEKNSVSSLHMRCMITASRRPSIVAHDRQQRATQSRELLTQLSPCRQQAGKRFPPTLACARRAHGCGPRT